MSYGAVNEDTEERTLECGAPADRAGHRYGGGCHDVRARLRSVAASSLPLLGAGAGDDTPAPGGRTVCGGDIRLPASVIHNLRAYAATSELTLGEIVAQAISRFLAAERGHG